MTESEGSKHKPPPDPSGIDEPHDVLAAEEFVIGTSENRFPGDPTGIREPHDVLAAEEFAMPAPGDGEGGLFGAGTPAEAASHPAAIAGIVALLVLLFVVVKRRS
jgi:hypothetical protein